jgi:hypothetical protein
LSNLFTVRPTGVPDEKRISHQRGSNHSQITAGRLNQAGQARSIDCIRPDLQCRYDGHRLPRPFAAPASRPSRTAGTLSVYSHAASELMVDDGGAVLQFHSTFQQQPGSIWPGTGVGGDHRQSVFALFQLSLQADHFRLRPVVALFSPSSVDEQREAVIAGSEDEGFCGFGRPA